MIEVIKAGLDNIQTIIDLGKQTFFETFEDKNSEEDMNNYLETAFNFDRIKSEIENPDSLFFIALADNIPCGYLKLNFNKFPEIIEQSEGQKDTFNTEELKNNKIMELQRIYILKSFIGQKVGKILMEKTLEISNQNNINYIWLGVADYNHVAGDFYKKWGFKVFGSHIFKTGSNIEKDLLMYLKL